MQGTFGERHGGMSVGTPAKTWKTATVETGFEQFLRAFERLSRIGPASDGLELRTS